MRDEKYENRAINEICSIWRQDAARVALVALWAVLAIAVASAVVNACGVAL